jgi:hypothetical protein
MTEWLDFIRGIVRPYLAIMAGTAIVGLGIYLGIKYADKDMANLVVGGVLGFGIGIFTSYFVERAIKKTEVK